MSIEELLDRVCVGYAAYLNTSISRFLRCVVEHNIHKWNGTKLKDAVTILSRYDISAQVSDSGGIIVDGIEQRSRKIGKIIKLHAEVQR